MFRLAIVTLVAASLAMPVPWLVSAASAATPNTPSGPDLKDTLEKGLKARRPVEFNFIALVVNKVNDGTLPVSLVNSTFLWARKHRPYPFPYFERGLRERAKKAGISI